MAKEYPFRPDGIHHNSKRDRDDSQSVPESRDSSTASFRGTGGQFPGVALQLDQVVEGVGSTQLAAMDQAYEQIADLRAVQGAVEEGVFSM